MFLKIQLIPDVFHRYIYTGIPDMKYMVFNTDYNNPMDGLDAPWSPCSDELKASRNSTNTIPFPDIVQQMHLIYSLVFI